VLAVGDAAFQAKCMKKMDDVTRSEGRTILFVSHNLAAVQRLCARGLFFEGGRLKKDAPISLALDAYQRSFESIGDPTQKIERLVPEGGARFLHWRLQESVSGEPHICQTREVCTFVFTLASRASVTNVGVSFILWNLDGALVVAGSLRESRVPNFDLEPGVFEIQVTIRLPIKAGLYQIEMRLYSETEGQIDAAFLEPKLHVLTAESNLPEQWQGLITEPLGFTVSALPASGAQISAGRADDQN
ncbi:MAG TPA: hypothetical protein VK961_06555, partial [Chthoniobacter sp.]|nr:hypothetical protein [Chthoniobacter sp.]